MFSLQLQMCLTKQKLDMDKCAMEWKSVMEFFKSLSLVSVHDSNKTVKNITNLSSQSGQQLSN